MINYVILIFHHHKLIVNATNNTYKFFKRINYLLIGT